MPTQIDPPDHIKYRRILNPWFSPSAVDARRAAPRDLCRALVEDVAPTGGCDFVTEFAMRFPTEVFLTMIGVPAADADLFVAVGRGLLRRLRRRSRPARSAWSRRSRGIREYWVAALEERRGEPEPRRATSPRTCSHATYDERPLTDAEMLDMLTVLVLAGLDTTRGQLGYLFRHLADHPDDRQRLVDDPELIPSAVEESLRYYTIIFGDGRKVTRDVEFHGGPLSKGDMVYGLVVRRQPRPARLRARGRVRHRPQAQPPPGLRRRPAPLPRRAPGPAGDAARRRGVAAGHPGLRARRPTSRSSSAAAAR